MERGDSRDVIVDILNVLIKAKKEQKALTSDEICSRVIDERKSISFSKYELLFKTKINPIFITKKEFRLMLKGKEENVGKQALYSHIILSNPEAFWECVFNGV